jgi:hypothetical protein
MAICPIHTPAARFTATVEAGGMLALHAGAVHSTGP